MAKPVEREELRAGGIAADRLRSIVERIERLDSERAALGEDRKEVFQEAKSAGYDVKALRILIRERKQDATDREETETLVEVYRRALGDFGSTALGDAAIRRVA